MKRVAITTLGCKVNQFDSAVLMAACQQAGWAIVPFETVADAYIVNTCTVTQSADAQSRHLLRRARRTNPEAMLIATGCYAQVAPDELATLEGVTHVIGTSHRQRVIDVLQECWQGHPKDEPSTHREIAAQQHRVRPYLKIQDGCDLHCTYCIIPRARGHQRSIPVQEVLAHLAAYADAGYEEVVLTGIHIGTYGRDLDPPTSFTGLLEQIVRVAPLRFVRISSLDPHEVTPQMIDLLASSPRFAPHLHIAIQSGSDAVLRRMGRRYRRQTVERVLHDLATAMPHVAIGTDLIVGFPGETEGDFAASCALIADSPLTYAHVFPYSPRSGTPATRLDTALPQGVIAMRAEQLRRLAQRRRRDYYRAQIGRVTEAISERRRDRRTGKMRAMTPHYVPLLIESARMGPGRRPEGYLPVRILDATADEVYATWI
ncbi:MAG: tRNA (N(6)-L-threonylcarbamoyladenosine(37)-C(2))-methylthiotransferase MtaB [Deltaproteobacteria bacterium]|nr:tRNA (N(6)-L-threonylcarbamoyladenosine(37)-C(2))-methylthiotransferase MtaB [Deltaproteobacteria bacterium]